MKNICIDEECLYFKLTILCRHQAGDHSMAVQLYSDTTLYQTPDTKIIYSRAVSYYNLGQYRLCIEVLTAVYYAV